MSEKTSERYVLPAEGNGVGQDVLLDTEITAVRLDSEQPARLARVLRQLPGGDWLDLRDAFVHEGRVVVVLPTTNGTLAQAAAGMPEHRRSALADMLRPTLRVLQEHGLSPRTLDASRILMSRAGLPLLVPVEGASPEATDHQLPATLGLLGVVEPGPARAGSLGDPGTLPAATVVDGTAAASGTAALAAAGAGATGVGSAKADTVTSPTVAGDPRPRPQPSAPVRRVGLSPAETGDRGRTWAGRGVVIVLVALLAWGGAIALAQRSGPEDQAPAAGAPGTGATAAVEETVASPVPPAPPVAEQPSTVHDLVEALRADPAAAGAAGPALLASLEAVGSSTGPQQAYTAAAAIELVRTGREAGTLTGPLVDQADELVRPIAQPADLAALVAMTSVDPAAFGPRTPKFLGRLQALQAAPAGEAATVEATDLLAIVRAGPGLGEFTPTFAALAEPALLPLTAQP